MLLLSLFTGMRMGEVGAFYFLDIDFENATISIERTLTRGKKINTSLEKTLKQRQEYAQSR